MLLLDSSIPNLLNLLMLVVTSIMAVLMYQTFKTGQKQTGISLAINQYNIYYTEFKGFLDEAQNLKFGSESEILSTVGIKDIVTKYNGLNYIPTFMYPMNLYGYNKAKEDDQLINGFRFGILFPLTRYYDRLYHFLQRIEKDKVLTNEYKSILYTYIERDLLQTYFRVCNYSFATERDYDLEPFKTHAYDHNTFYNINQFYIKHDIFQYKSLDFYKKTT